MNRKAISIILTGIFMITGLAGCSSTRDISIESTELESAELENSAERSVYLVTNVYGDGQKPYYLVLDYEEQVDPDSVEISDFDVTDYDIVNVYVNDNPYIPEESVAGQYVIVEISTDYTTTGYGGSGTGDGFGGDHDREMGTSGDFNENERPEKDFSENNNEQPSGRGGFSETPSNQLTVTLTQQGEITSTEGAALAISEGEITTEYSENVNLLVENFEQYVFTASDGVEMMYNLYLPDNYEAGESYPMIIFMPDATGEGNDEYKTLTESLGAVIWTTDESQLNNECIVLAPQYVDNNGDDPTYTMELINAVSDNYKVDTSRLYLVGQSSGTIRSIKLMIDYPETFAAAMLVAGQADEEYVDKLQELSNQNIWMICSAGDERAYPGMTAIVEAVESCGTDVTIEQWSADLGDEEQEALALQMEKYGTSINWTVYDAGTVMEDDVEATAATEHMNTWRVAYDLDTIREWLFSNALNGK